MNVLINIFAIKYFPNYAFACKSSSKLSGRFGRCEYLWVKAPATRRGISICEIKGKTYHHVT